jgi:hypothetical protein
VIRQRDASSLPFSLCAMVTIQCTAWTVYGHLQSDMSTFANNLVGVVLGSVQLALIFSCPGRRAGAAAAGGADKDKEAVAGGKSGDASALGGSPVAALESGKPAFSIIATAGVRRGLEGDGMDEETAVQIEAVISASGIGSSGNGATARGARRARSRSTSVSGSPRDSHTQGVAAGNGAGAVLA